MAAAAFGQNAVIASEGLLKFLLRQDALPLAPLVGVEQEGAQFLGPGLLMLFVEEFQFPQMVLIAQGVQSILVSEVRLEMIVDDPVFTPGQNVELIHGFGPTFGMDAIKG